MLFKKKHKLFLLFMIYCLCDNLWADDLVQINVSDKIVANAKFYPGSAEKPVVLILHGFMLTHNFPVVQRLANSLNESGYTVLTPTLSLNINKRKKSLACEAIHTHSLETDSNELKLWINWLKEKTGKKIVLIGHSIGSLHSAYYLSHHEENNVKNVIFLTLPDLDPKTQKSKTIEFREQAKQLIAQKNNALYEFGLLYCKKYPTTAHNYLSYSQLLSKENVVKYLEAITIKKSLIFGNNDKVIDQLWNKKLSRYDIDIKIIDAADHFFDNEHEFDLLDNVESILNESTDDFKNDNFSEERK